MSTLAEKIRIKVQMCSAKYDCLLSEETASIKEESLGSCHSKASTQGKLTDVFPIKKKRDRFNGKTEEEVLAKLLPDHLDFDLDIIIIGINPGLTAAHVGHHYAGPGNHFWKCLYLSGLTSEQMNAFDDYKLKNMGIGFTNIVSRTSRGSADLSKTEIKEGAEILIAKIQQYRPKIAVFNGKGIYEVFCGHKNFFFGKQPEPFPGTNTVIFVMPSSSARCSQLPRAIDKAPFYVALKKLRDYLSGLLPQLNESEVIFPDLELKVEPKRERESGVNIVKQETPLCSKAANKRSRQSEHGLATETVPPDVKVQFASLTESERSKQAKQTSSNSLAFGYNSHVAHSVVQSCCQNASVNAAHLTFPISSAANVGTTSSSCDSFVAEHAGMTVPAGEAFNVVKVEAPFDLSRYGSLSYRYQGYSGHSPP